MKWEENASPHTYSNALLAAPFADSFSHATIRMPKPLSWAECEGIIGHEFCHALGAQHK